MKKIIVVRGSEDGVLGVAGNIKRAVEIARESGYPVKYNEVLKAVNACKFSNGLFVSTIDLPHRASVEFNAFHLNV